MASKMPFKAVYQGFAVVETNGRRERVRVTDSVGFLAVDPVRRKAILVSQAREPMMRDDNPEGMLIEITAGRFDIKIGVRGLVVKEAAEELGVTIQKRDVKLLNGGKSLALSPGILTERQYIAYFEADLGERIDDRSQRVFGVEADGERITHRVYTFKQLKRMRFEDMKTLAVVREYFKDRKERKRKKQR